MFNQNTWVFVLFGALTSLAGAGCQNDFKTSPSRGGEPSDNRPVVNVSNCAESLEVQVRAQRILSQFQECFMPSGDGVPREESPEIFVCQYPNSSYVKSWKDSKAEFFLANKLCATFKHTANQIALDLEASADSILQITHHPEYREYGFKEARFRIGSQLFQNPECRPATSLLVTFGMAGEQMTHLLIWRQIFISPNQSNLEVVRTGFSCPGLAEEPPPPPEEPFFYPNTRGYGYP